MLIWLQQSRAPLPPCGPPTRQLGLTFTTHFGFTGTQCPPDTNLNRGRYRRSKGIRRGINRRPNRALVGFQPVRGGGTITEIYPT